MSAQTLELIKQIKEKFNQIAANPEARSKITSNDITQYNVTNDGKIVHTLHLNLKDFVLSEVPAANDIEITISEEDVVGIFLATTTLVELKAAVSFTKFIEGIYPLS